MPKPRSKFAITEFDRWMLAVGASAGFILVLNLSHSFVASLLLGVPMGIGGNCVVLIFWKLALPNGVELPDLFKLDRKQRYGMLAVIVLSMGWVYWQAANNLNSFDLLCMTIGVAEFAAIFGYGWYRHHRST